MGLLGRKKWREEKAKIKERKKINAKELPKGLNRTNTNFKVKKIVIGDQIKAHPENTLLFKNILSIPELVKRFSHHNARLQIEALRGVKEIYSSNSKEELNIHFTEVFDGLVKLILARSANVRKFAMILLSTLLLKIDTDKIKNIFHLLNTHILCGMTHTDICINRDTLKFIDIVLKYVPYLFADYALNLIIVCLNLISTQSEETRTIKLNLNAEKTKSIKVWKLQVLQRIATLLTVLTKYHKDFKTSLSKEQDGLHRLVYYSKTKPNHFPLFSKAVFSYNAQDELSIYHSSLVTETPKELTIQKVANNVIPVLIQICIEILPDNQSLLNEEERESTELNVEDAVMLKLMVDIMEQMWSLNNNLNGSNILKKNSLSKKFGDTIFDILIRKKFPYSVRLEQDNDLNKLNVTTFQINLILANLVTCYCEPSTWKEIIPHLSECFNDEVKLSQAEYIYFLTCAERLLKNEYFSESEYFLAKIVSQSKKENDAYGNYCFKLLSNFALDTSLTYIHEVPIFKLWLEDLPKLITKRKICVHHLETISKIAVRNFHTFSDSLDQLIEVILDNIPKIKKIVGAEEHDYCYFFKKIIDLLFWVQDWDDELASNLQEPIKNNYWGEELTKHLQDILHLKKLKETTSENTSSIVYDDVPTKEKSQLTSKKKKGVKRKRINTL